MLPSMLEPGREAPPRLPIVTKISLTATVWKTYARVRSAVKRHPLPQAIERLSEEVDRRDLHIEPKRLGRIVYRTTTIGPWSPRCLFTALVLYRMLVDQGDAPQLVIGLPREARTKDAHAWIEIDGRDIGPPPGSRGHSPLARYGPGSAG
jgi:Transglutaminase-like superfamily